VPRGRLELVRNGIDIAHLDAQVRRCSPPQAGRRRPRIITPANFFPIKGHEWLIRAVPAVQARFADVEFVLAGDGDSRTDMERLARDLGVAPSVTFAGSVENVIAEMLESDLFVLPSLSEGLSIALLEALALGMPVVATNTGGTPEVVADGQTGLLVAPRNPQALADAIVALLNDSERARQLGANGRELVRQQFSARAMIDRLEAAYVQLARARVRPAPAQ
jgi:glycosyltransferase involved in cell wall biosynthesis